MEPIPIPLEAARHIRMVSSFEELIATRFAGDVNALCWPRQLPGDFQNIIDRLALEDGITSVDVDDLGSLALTPAGAVAREVLLADLALLRAQGLAPTLDCITGYPRDEAAGPVPTDVYSFHVDSAPVQTDTYLCTYIGAPSEGLANASAIRRVDDTETRAKLLNLHGGPDDDAFCAYLRDNCFDLHYSPRPGARPYAFGIGHFWRIAIAYPDCPAPPCIHRAPLTLPGAQPRLLLIS